MKDADFLINYLRKSGFTLLNMCYCQITVWEFSHVAITDLTVTVFRSYM